MEVSLWDTERLFVSPSESAATGSQWWQKKTEQKSDALFSGVQKLNSDFLGSR